MYGIGGTQHAYIKEHVARRTVPAALPHKNKIIFLTPSASQWQTHTHTHTCLSKEWGTSVYLKRHMARCMVLVGLPRKTNVRPDPVWKPVADTWLRTNAVNTNGAAAEVFNFDRLGKKIRPGTFGKIKAG